jgi:hypothetical protein
MSGRVRHHLDRDLPGKIPSVARIVHGAVRAMRLAAWFLAAWPQAFEHSSQE